MCRAQVCACMRACVLIMCEYEGGCAQMVRLQEAGKDVEYVARSEKDLAHRAVASIQQVRPGCVCGCVCDVCVCDDDDVCVCVCVCVCVMMMVCVSVLEGGATVLTGGTAHICHILGHDPGAPV